MDSDSKVLAEVKELLRTALRVGPDVEIADTMPLVGGTIDLDSIDILLIVSTVEKKFGIKIPSEALGRSTFDTVWTLAEFVERNHSTLKVEAAVAGNQSVPPEDYLARLPHGPEFRFVSQVREVVEGRGAMGVWNVLGDELFLKGHFPGRPIVPGVLITEALAQIAGLAAAKPGEVGGVLGSVEMKFMAPVLPPASIALRAETVVSEGPMRRCEVVASVGGMAVARGVLMIHFGARV